MVGPLERYGVRSRKNSRRARSPLAMVVVLATIAVMALVPMLILIATPATATNHVVDMVDYDFSPKFLTVGPGDTVQWHNAGTLEHTATSNTSAWTEVIELPGATSSPRTMPSAGGNYTYICSFHFSTHPTMWGAIIVDTSIPEFSSSSFVVLGMMVIALCLMLIRPRSR